MRDQHYMFTVQDTIERMKGGVFLTVRSGRGLNTMTIGWAAFGVVWNKPVMMVAVRPSRYTFGIIEAAGDFTVTVPLDDRSRELAYCGSKSGRDGDKLKACDLETAAGRRTVSPVIKIPGRHYECRIIFKSPMDPALFDKESHASLYPKGDLHTLYFGEILACYETD